MPVCLIGLGSNQGDRHAALEAAVAQLGQQPEIVLLARSAWRETSPIGGPADQSPYLNGAIRIETSLGPQQLLARLLQIEAERGRQRSERWAARPLDLDLLLYDRQVIDSPELTVPHPRMAWRRFVLEPAAEAAGAMLHPTIGWTVAQLLAHLNATRPYVAITGPIAAGKTRLARRLALAAAARLIAEQPDWDQLDAFYADPAGHGEAMELEFLVERARRLTDDASNWPASGWTLSDFWFDQSAAFARAWLFDERLADYFERYEALRRGVARPKLIVWLDAPAGELFARVRRRNRPCERRLTEDQLERIRQKLREQVFRPGQGPILRAEGRDADSIFTETMAAMKAME